MRIRFILGILFCMVGKLSAQTIEQHVQQQRPGEGQVVLHISEAVRQAILGHTGNREEKSLEERMKELEAFRNAEKVKAMGYRVQVYGGGNSRQSKLAAQRASAQVKRMFPEYPVYTHFESPRWVCKVGNFTNREEANEAWQRIKTQGGFRQAIVVKDVILIAK